MKKIATLLLFASLSLIGFTSCSDDEDTQVIQPVEVNHLLGTWKLNTMSLTSYENGEIVSEYTDLPMSTTMQWDHTFKDDNTVDFIMAIPSAELSQTGSGTYVKNGNTLTMTIENEAQTFEIKELTSDNLNLKLVEEYEEEGISYKDEIEQKFTR